MFQSFLLPILDRVEGGVRKQEEAALGMRAHHTLVNIMKVKKVGLSDVWISISPWVMLSFSDHPLSEV